MINYIFTDRFGGVSKGRYESFNLALHVGDKEEDVLKNREILKKKLGVKKTIFMDQHHLDEIEIIDNKEIYRCDAIITDKKGIALCVMVADCIPILLYSENLVAAVHAGRNGTFLKISKKCVEKMRAIGAKEIRAVLGPSIRSCCYEVGEEIVEIVEKNFKKEYIKRGRFLDIVSMNIDQLNEAGVNKIEVSPICTCCNRDYFSYRRENITGRFIGAIWRE